MNTPCISTHGGAGYAAGSYWDGDAIVCACGHRIENPSPTGGTTIFYTFKENPWYWFWGKVKRVEPRWPDHIRGETDRQYKLGIYR